VIFNPKGNKDDRMKLSVEQVVSGMNGVSGVSDMKVKEE
jgi:hypothetical protein